MHRHELSEVQWQKVSPLIHRHGRSSPKLVDRSFVNAVIFVLKTGTPWRDLPDRYGRWKTVYNRFASWSKAGPPTSSEFSKRSSFGVDQTGSLVDATIARAHQDAAGGKGGPEVNDLGRSRGGFSTKIHAPHRRWQRPVRFTSS